ncbi:MAG: type II secretion system protein N [Pseudomonadota bacterium]|nr:type II secretion system protein N [Pseudomonadota bacterium]
MTPLQRHISPRTLWYLLIALLIALAGTQAAKLFWLLYAPPLDRPTASAQMQQGQPVAAPERAIEPLLGARLFGTPTDSARVIPEPETVDAPETSLKLVLQGIVEADDADASIALIAEPRGATQIYRAGDELPGNAAVHRIQAYQVLIRRAGRIESLRFAEDDSAPLYERTADPTQAMPVASPRLFVDAIRDQYQQDPTGTLGRFGLVRRSNGAAEVGPGNRSQLLRQIGLQPGDRIYAVNGFNLEDFDENPALLSGLLTQEQLRVDLERNGTRLDLEVPLP